MAAMVKLVVVFEMLRECAPDYTCVETDHYFRITFGGKVYPNLPTGPHGKMGTKEIEGGHVRQMVRALGLGPCARRVLPKLYQ